MVPCWIGISYCRPVRLSVIVSVSAMRDLSRVRNRPSVVAGIRGGVGRRLLHGHAVRLGQPASEVSEPAAFAAEGTPRGIDRLAPAVHAERFGASHPCPPNLLIV